MRPNFTRILFISAACFLVLSGSWIVLSKNKLLHTIRHTALLEKESDEENEELEESKQKRQFIEEAFKQEFEKTKDPATGTVPRERLLFAQQQLQSYLSRLSGQRAINGINWVERGPSVVGGRTRALIFDKNDPTNNTVFAGGVAGGLWKTNNIGATPPTWTKIGDLFDNIAISCITQDASNTNTLYFGTGETWGNIDALRGLGIWKSSDGGNSWHQLASTNNEDFYYTQKIVVNSTGTVFAATNVGVKKSSDGGNTWSGVLSGKISDLELASNGDLYASNFFGRVYKSPAANAGATGSWSNVSPTGTFARVEIATAPSNNQKVYLLCQGANSNDCEGIFRSDNGGSSWVPCPIPTIIDQGSNSIFTRGQAWYDLIAAVDPNDANTVVIGGVDALKSIDGGATWNQVSTWSLFGAPRFKAIVHADQHAILYAPGSSSRAIWGTDGGVFLTDSLNIAVNDSTKPAFTAKNDGYNVTQFYGCALYPDAGSNYFLAGAQDNGSRRFSDATPGIQQTSQASGGDGAFCHIDQLDPSRQLTSYVYNSYYRSLNGGASFVTATSNQTRGSFVNPTDYDPRTRFLFGDATIVSSNTGGSYSRYNTDSTGTRALTFVTVPAFNAGSVTNTYVSPITSDRVFFGLNNGRVVYVDSASVLTSTTRPGVVIKTGTGSVSGIATEPGNENHMLVTYSNYGVQSVFESTNALSASPTWTNIEGNLPDMPVRWVIFNPTNADQALIATELGVWTTDDINGGATEWNPTNGGLANVRVDMLKVRKSDNTIAAATHGRGLFTTTLNNVVLPNINFLSSKLILGEAGTVATNCNLSYRDTAVTLMLSNPAAENVTVKVSVDPSSTAKEGQDFDLLSNTVTFAAGSTEKQSVMLRIYDDNNSENTESILLTYSITGGQASAAKGSTFQTFQVDIADNDVSPSGPYLAQFVSGPYSTNLGPSSPLQSTISDKKSQYLYRASELRANGLKAGPISAINFSVTTKASTIPYLGFTIKLGSVPTTTADLTAGFVIPADFTTIYSAPESGFTPLFGENEFPVSSFNWDGNSNIVFEFCYNDTTLGAAGSDDILAGETAAYNAQARRTSTVTTDQGCAFATSNTSSTPRPVITFSQVVAQTPIASALHSLKQAHLGPFETVNFFNPADNRIIATVLNLGSWDYGCTSIEIDREGSGALPFQDNNAKDYVASKTYHFVPTNNNPNGNVRVTLYLTAAEKAGWESATGNSFLVADLVKISTGQITDVTPADPHLADVSTGTTVARGPFGSDFLIAGDFTTGLSGIGIGSLNAALPVTGLDLKGSISNKHALLEWSTVTEVNTSRFEIEKSSDGRQFKKIGAVTGSGNSTVAQNYHFTDPDVAGAIQYYRLKTVDLDGRFAYSTVVPLRNGKNIISVTPNPFNSYVDINFNEQVSGKVEATISTAAGKLLLKTSSSAITGSKWRIFPGNNIMSSGIYILKITRNGTSSSFKLIKD